MTQGIQLFFINHLQEVLWIESAYPLIRQTLLFVEDERWTFCEHLPHTPALDYESKDTCASESIIDVGLRQ